MSKIKLTIIAFLFSSCGDSVVTTSRHDIEPYMIQQIEEVGDSLYCKYSTAPKKIEMPIIFLNEISFYDTIGKYKVGDKIKAEFEITNR